MNGCARSVVLCTPDLFFQSVTLLFDPNWQITVTTATRTASGRYRPITTFLLRIFNSRPLRRMTRAARVRTHVTAAGYTERGSATE